MYKTLILHRVVAATKERSDLLPMPFVLQSTRLPTLVCCSTTQHTTHHCCRALLLLLLLLLLLPKTVCCYCCCSNSAINSASPLVAPHTLHSHTPLLLPCTAAIVPKHPSFGHMYLSRNSDRYAGSKASP